MDVSLISDAYTGLLKTIKVFAIFNKVNGAYIQWVNWHEPHAIDENIFDIAVIENFSPNTQQIIGEYPNFKVVNTADLPQEVSEEFVDTMTAEEITGRFSIPNQINTISKAILAIANHLQANNLPEIQELEEQVMTIDEILRVGNLRKEGYSEDDSFVFVTKEDRQQEYNKIFEGGLGETIGPRQIVSGS